MSRKKKSSFAPFPFETKGGAQFVRVYYDLLYSEAFLSLKQSQRALYVYMRAQLGYNKSLAPNQFEFNKGIWKDKYKLYTSKAKFYNDRDTLISTGFIKIAKDENGIPYDGKHTRAKTVYEFSTRWKDYGTEAFTIPLKDMPHSMQKKEAKK